MRPAAFTAALSFLVILGACAQTGTPPGSGASTNAPPYAGSRAGVCGAREYAATSSRASRVVTSLKVPNGFTIETIASIGDARELAALPNGDLIVGTTGSNVYIVADAEGAAAPPRAARSTSPLRITSGEFRITANARRVRYIKSPT